VVFVREIVPRRMIAFVARTVYNENYVYRPMRSRVELTGKGGVCYEWRHGARWNALSGEISGEPAFVAPESEEAFITEHYWGYAAQRDGSTVEYEVEHPQWRVWRCGSARFDCDAAAFYGPSFAEPLAAPPSSAFVAEGSAVTVRRGRRI
jgi:hypothetical protein